MLVIVIVLWRAKKGGGRVCPDCGQELTDKEMRAAVVITSRTAPFARPVVLASGMTFLLRRSKPRSFHDSPIHGRTVDSRNPDR